MNITGISMIVVTVFFAAFVQGSTGVGFSMICMAILPFVMSYRLSTQMAIALTLVFSLMTLTRSFKKVNVRLVLIPLASSFLGGFLGFKTLLFAPETMLKLVLGCAIVLTALYFLIWEKNLSFSENSFFGVLFGSLSGFFSGVAGIGGPPLVVYYLGVFKADKEGYFSTLTFSYLLGALYQISLHGMAGTIGVNLLQGVLVAICPLVIGYLIGRRVFAIVNHIVLQKLVYGVMVVMGSSIILKVIIEWMIK